MLAILSKQTIGNAHKVKIELAIFSKIHKSQKRIIYKKRLLIPGYCRAETVVGNKINFKLSEKAINLIQRYIEKFPLVFDVLRCKHYAKTFYYDEFCVDSTLNDKEKKAEQGKKYLLAIKEWIESEQVSKLPLIDFDAKCFSVETIAFLENAADRYYAEQIAKKPKVWHLKRVPLHQIYFANPEIAWSPTNQHTVSLSNRCAVLRSDQGTPFATKGTVVGVHSQFVELLTDCKVMKAGTLHHRCSDYRGLVLPYNQILNLTPNQTLKHPPKMMMQKSKSVQNSRNLKKIQWNMYNQWMMNNNKNQRPPPPQNYNYFGPPSIYNINQPQQQSYYNLTDFSPLLTPQTTPNVQNMSMCDLRQALSCNPSNDSNLDNAQSKIKDIRSMKSI